MAIGVETLTIDSECPLEKELNELIHSNLTIVLHLNINQVDSHHSYSSCLLI